MCLSLVAMLIMQPIMSARLHKRSDICVGLPMACEWYQFYDHEGRTLITVSTMHGAMCANTNIIVFCRNTYINWMPLNH